MFLSTVKSCHVLLFLASSCLFMACGSGGLDSDTNQPSAKVLVNAGADRSVNEQSLTTLSAQASGQSEALTYAWTVSPSLVITHEDTSSGLASVTAPVTTETITYTFTVTVIDGDGNRGQDEVIYTVLPVNAAPIVVLDFPEFEGLAEKQFPAGETIVLDASRSTDTDAAASLPPIKAYMWQQTAGVSVLTGVSTQGDDLSFITPILEQANTLSFNLTITDQEGALSTETVTFTIQSARETQPKVNAGLAHQVFSGESILLTGMASSNVPASRPLVTEWLNDSELETSIANEEGLNTYAVAPAVEEQQDMTFTLRVQDQQGNQVQDSITVSVNPLPIQPLNDTGVHQQVTNDEILTAHQSAFPGQDGQRGQDIIHINALSAKAGRGQQGFDFTKLDAVGDEVDDPSQPWSCVRDNITGLIWEVKTEPTSTDVHNNGNTYTWYQEENNGDFAGDDLGTSASCSLTNCHTQGFLTQINAQGLCNFRDWRLPTHDELLSIVHFGQTTAPMLDQDYFPYGTASLTAPVWYWTQDSSADGLSAEGAQNAWAIDFASGNDNFLDKSTAANVRLVRAGR